MTDTDSTEEATEVGRLPRRRSKTAKRAARRERKKSQQQGAQRQPHQGQGGQPPAGGPPPRELQGRTPGQVVALGRLQTEVRQGPEGGAFFVGPAGSGKTFLAVALGVRCLMEGLYERMVVARPTVEAGEKLGFLPGNLGEKLEPWLVPVFDAVDKMAGASRRQNWLKTGVLEVCSFQHIQGRTFENAYCVLDEGQNTTPFQMETFLTRPGEGSFYVVAGDPHAQVAIPGGSGMVRALQLIQARKLPVPILRLTHDDIVRSKHSKMWARAFYDDHRPVEALEEEAPAAWPPAFLTEG